MRHVPMLASLCVLLPALALAACSAEPTPEAPAARTDEASAPAPAPEANAAPLGLAPLEQADIAGNPLRGELGCHFTADTGMLLLAKGFVADAQAHAEGLAKTAQGLQRLVAQEAGGFDALIDGTVFTSEGITFTVTRTADEPLGTGEAPPYPAQLTARRAGGAQETRAGTWTCGP